jgi:hypothetical protein
LTRLAEEMDHLSEAPRLTDILIYALYKRFEEKPASDVGSKLTFVEVRRRANSFKLGKGGTARRSYEIVFSTRVREEEFRRVTQSWVPNGLADPSC